MNISKFAQMALVLAALCAGSLHAETETAGSAVTVVTQVYKQAAGRPLKVFIHQPPAWRPTDRRPALLMIHGGGWVGGGVTVFDRQSEYFAQRGMVCFVIEYRLLDRANFDPPAICIQDARSAVRWVRAHAGELGVDATRIAAIGASAGGHLAAYLSMMEGNDDPQDDVNISARVQAALLLNPVLHNGPGEYGYGYKRTAGRYREYSPFHNVSASAAPTAVFIGDADKLIPIAMIHEFAAAMRKAGVRCDVHVYDGQGHSFFTAKNENGKYLRLTLAAADEFLVDLGWLKPRPATPGTE